MYSHDFPLIAGGGSIPFAKYAHSIHSQSSKNGSMRVCTVCSWRYLFCVWPFFPISKFVCMWCCCAYAMRKTTRKKRRTQDERKREKCWQQSKLLDIKTNCFYVVHVFNECDIVVIVVVLRKSNTMAWATTRWKSFLQLTNTIFQVPQHYTQRRMP